MAITIEKIIGSSEGNPDTGLTARNKINSNFQNLADAILNIQITGGSISFSKITDKPTTLAGYGITDSASASHVHTFASLTNKPSTLSGYGIVDAALINHTHAFSALTDKPATLLGYGITDAYTKSQIDTYLDIKLDKATFNDLFEKVNIGTEVNPIYAIEAKYNFYGLGEVSAYGIGIGGSGGSGLIQTVYGYNNLGDAFLDSTLTDTFNAYTINRLATRIGSLESGSALSILTSGLGNAITSAVKTGTTIDFKKELTFSLSTHTHDYIPLSQKGALNGVASLDGSGLIISSQLPSYVDDVIEVSTYANLPVIGESGKIYVTIDTSLTYRWTGSVYVEISKSIALGETSSTAYRGDFGAIAYAHSQIAGGTGVHISGTERTNWDLAYTNNHTHTNKSLLDAFSQSDNDVLNHLSVVDGKLKVDIDLYSIGEVSAFGVGSGTGGSGLIQTVYGLSGLGGSYSDTILTDTFNAYTINSLHNRINSLESGSALSFVTTGIGNVVTSVTKSGTSVSVIKGITAILEGDYRLTNARNNPYALTFSGYSTASYDGSTAVNVALPTKVSQLTNDSAFLTAITKSQVEGVLTGNITSHTHSQYLTGNQTVTLSGDITGSGSTGITTTLKNTGTAGTYRSVTTDAKGRVTAGTNPTTLSGYGISDLYYKYNSNTNDFNTALTEGQYKFESNAVNGPVTGYGVIDTKVSDFTTHNNTNNWIWQDAYTTENGDRYWRNKTNSGTWYSWRKLWDSGNFTNLNQLTTRNFSDLQNKPTSLSGYGITDAVNVSTYNTHVSSNLHLTDAQRNVLSLLSVEGGKLKIDADTYSTGELSAYGVGSGGSSGGLIQTVYSYSNLGETFLNSTLTDTFNAYTINQLASRINSLEGGSALTFNTTGSGNAITSISKTGTTVTSVLGSTFSLDGHTHSFASLTSKPTTLGGYGIVDAALNSHTHNYLPLTGGVLSGAITISTNGDRKIIIDNTDNETNYSYIAFRQNGVEYGMLGTNSLGLNYNNHTIYDSSNFTNLNQLTTRNFSDIQNKPTTLAGYGIVDAALSNHTHSQYVDLSGNQIITGNKTFGILHTNSNYPLISKLSSYKSFVFYHNNGNSFFIAPSITNDSEDWNWANQYKFDGNNGSFTANSFIKAGGTSSQFLKADGSVDGNSYWHTGNFNPDSKANTSGTYGGLNVGYATSAGNADTLDGYHVSSLYRTDNANLSTVDWNAKDGIFYGTISAANRIYTGYDSGVNNSVSCSNWFRSSGSSGWINDTYGGGIYMTDNTYVKVYNSKAFQVDSTLDASIKTSGGIQIGSAQLIYNATNNTLRVQKSDGSAIGFYSTGEVSSYGVGSTGGTSYINANLHITGGYNIIADGSISTGGKTGVADGLGGVYMSKYGSMEISGGSPFIDFHFGNSTADFTTRLIEAVSGELSVSGKFRIGDTYGDNGSYALHVTGNSYFTGAINSGGAGTFNGGSFSSLRSLKNMHNDWNGNALNEISKVKVRSFNYKSEPIINKTLGFIIDEIPDSISEYVLFGKEKDSINLYTLHALSFLAHQQTKTRLEELEEEVIDLKQKINELENKQNG